MSRVGKAPVIVPEGVEVHFSQNVLQAKGKKGSLSMKVSEDVVLSIESGVIKVTPKNDNSSSRMIWGTTRKLLSNLIQGVSSGFSVELEIQGVGYKAAVQGKDLVLSLGFSHEIKFPIPSDISISCDKPTSIVVQGIDCQKVGQVSANIRMFKEPEPYKGKGIRYKKDIRGKSEIVLRKEGKKK